MDTNYSDNKSKNHTKFSKFKSKSFGGKLEAIFLLPFDMIIDRMDPWVNKSYVNRTIRVRVFQLILYTTVIIWFLLAPTVLILLAMISPLLFVFHKYWQGQGYVNHLQDQVNKTHNFIERVTKLEENVRELYIGRYYKQQIIDLNQFDLKISYENYENPNISSVFDVYEYVYGPKSINRSFRIPWFLFLLVLLLIGVYSIANFILDFWKNFEILITSNGTSFSISSIQQILLSQPGVTENIEYIPSSLRVLYATVSFLWILLAIFLIFIIFPVKLIKRNLNVYEPEYRRNFKQWDCVEFLEKS